MSLAVIVGLINPNNKETDKDMKLKAFLATAVLAAVSAVASAQTANDPVVMTIAGQPVHRSEFEYSYNKNNSEGVIDKKTVEEYVDLFINYKLKVQAALDENMDTLTSYKKEFMQYRDMQIRPALINDADVEEEAHNIYNKEKERIGPDGLCRPAHIFMRLAADADAAAEAKQKQRIDSVYNALKNGADFAELARTVSEDQGAAKNNGVIGWISHGQTFEEFDKAAFALQPGQMSEVVKSPVGYHIIRMEERKDIDPYDSLRTSIMTFIDRRNIREQIIDRKVEAEAEALGKTKEEVMNAHAAEMQATDPELDNLVREYHDGLLLYEISNREVWDKAAKDEAGLKAYFKKHKKQYKWDEPRYKGMVYHVKDEADIAAVKKCVKGLAFDKWAEALRTTFNGDSVIRIRVEKGLFKKGDNGLVDKEVFGVADAKVKSVKGYPLDAVYGKIQKAPKEMDDVRGQVTADYQQELEKLWVAQLRKRYTFSVDEQVLKTVNKH